MAITLYGIKNCDTVKKARSWLNEHGISHEFHDYKASGIDRAKLEHWCDTLGWEAVLNRFGTTFRKLPAPEQTALNADKAIALMLAQPSMIKRPLLDVDGQLLLGFKLQSYESQMKRQRG